MGAAKSASFEYIPALDGFRAVAILLVVVAHAGLGNIVPGGFGVTLFFFISGFLITRLLVAEHAKTGEVSISSFYVRRFLRLGPALVAMIAIVCVCYWLSVGPISPWEVLAAIFYSMNYYQLFYPLDMPIGVLWSLAVEEHYYAIFPLIFALAWKSRERFLLGLMLFAIAVLVWRIYLVQSSDTAISQIYYRTDTRIDSILYGAILAVLLEIRRYDAVAVKLGSTSAFAAGLLILLMTLLYRNASFRETARYSLQGLALMPIFVFVLFDHRGAFARRVLELPITVWIGKLSYSIYLWHSVVSFFMGVPISESAPTMRSLIAVPLTVLVASASYYGVERPFQAMRKRFRKGAHGSGKSAEGGAGGALGDRVPAEAIAQR